MAGFTLIELMVAVGLLAILSIMVFSSINSSFSSFEVLSKRSRAQSEFSSAFSVINDDLFNLAPRAVRTGTNKREHAFIIGDTNSEFVMEFTRSGNEIVSGDNVKLKENGFDNPQVGLSRVAYKFADSTLYRYEWGVLDRDRKDNDNIQDRESILMEEVAEVQILAYTQRNDSSLQEETRWPPTANRGRTRNKEHLLLPAAISLRIILLDEREYEFFFPGTAGTNI